MGAPPQRVDPIIPNMELVRFDPETETLGSNDMSYCALSVSGDVASLESFDKPSGVLRVWFLLLEGLASATMGCSRNCQPHVLDMLFNLLRDVFHFPGMPIHIESS